MPEPRSSAPSERSPRSAGRRGVDRGRDRSRRSLTGKRSRRSGKRALQHASARLPCRRDGRENAGEIVAHVEIVGIDQQRPLDPFARPFLFAKERIAAGQDAQRGAVARVLLDCRAGPRRPSSSRPSRIFACVAERLIAGRKHRPGVEVARPSFRPPFRNGAVAVGMSRRRR